MDVLRYPLNSNPQLESPATRPCCVVRAFGLNSKPCRKSLIMVRYIRIDQRKAGDLGASRSRFTK